MYGRSHHFIINAFTGEHFMTTLSLAPNLRASLKTLAAVLVTLAIAVIYVWQAYQAGSINGYFASAVIGLMLVVCAAHAWLFHRTYRWAAVR
jgi:membrane protein YdbS with pleckstrin-like domain